MRRQLAYNEARLFEAVSSVTGRDHHIDAVRCKPCICKRCFKDYEHEAYLVNFGTLTGTASNGMILLRETDPNYETPTSSIFILSQFPAMIAVAPLLLLLNLSARSISGCLIALGIFTALFTAYTVFLVLSSRKKKDPADKQD